MGCLIGEWGLVCVCIYVFMDLWMDGWMAMLIVMVVLMLMLIQRASPGEDAEM
jgi:hypothetical protein